MQKKIFEGIRILDVSHFISGPWSTIFFAQQGAEVIKIEPPPFGDSMRMFSFFDKQIFPIFSILNNNKKSLVLNLNKPQAQEIFKKLIKISDVVVDNLVVGTMERWGLGYEQLKLIKPDIIYVSISGFGRTGIEKYVKKTAFDLIAQAASGILDAMDIETSPGIPFADFSTAHIAAISIASALYYREKTGKGQLIDISMQDVMYALNLHAHARECMDRASKLDIVSRILPIYSQYPTKDGKKVAIVILTEPQWKRFCENVLKRPELISDPKFDNPIKRFDHLEELDKIVESYTKEKEQSLIIEELESQKIPCSEVRTIHDVRDHPQLKARNMLIDNWDFSRYNVKKATMPGPIIKYSETPSTIDHMAPELGAQNEEIICGLLGYSVEEYKKLKRKIM